MALSVIIPVRNDAPRIERQLAALSKQTGSALGEVIVADNGSRDDLRSVIARWTDRLPALRVVDASRKRGSAFAR